MTVLHPARQFVEAVWELLPGHWHRLCESGVRKCWECSESDRVLTAARGGLTRQQWLDALAEERREKEAHAIAAAAALRPTP